MGKRLSLVAALGIALAIPHAAWAKPEKAPDWVHEAVAQTLPKFPEDTKAVVLLDDTTYTVGADGKAVEHVRRVVKILRPQGRDEAIVHVPYDDDTKILSMTLWSISPGGQEDVVKDKEMSDRGFLANIEFDQDKYRVAQAPWNDPGTVVAYEYQQRVRPYVTETTWSFQGELPYVKESFTLELPAGYTYGTAWFHHQPIKVADLEHQQWRWELQDVPGILLDRVPMPPPRESLEGRMTIYYSAPGLALSNDGTWKSIGEWYSKLSSDRLTASPEIAEKAQELTAGKVDFVDKAQAISEFVQHDIRYFAIELGIGGYQPHAAGDIFRNRYGDCKDKATLLTAMLSSVGIHSALMMVDISRGVVDPDTPSLVGDHMIAAIEIPQGYESPRMHTVVRAKTGKRYLIVDPTWDKTPFGQVEHELQGGYGVLMEGADTEAIQIPLVEPDLNTIHRTATFHLDRDGQLRGTVTDSRFGDLAESRRELYTGHDAHEQEQFLDRMLKQDFTIFSASDVKTENAGALDKDFTLSFEVTADHYAKQVGPLLMVRPRVLGSLNLDVDHKPREFPIDLGETKQVVDDYTIELPSGYVVDELPDPVKLDLDFASYQSQFEVKGSTLHYKRTFTVRKVTLPSDRYAEVQKLAGMISADEENQAVLRKQ